MWSSNFKTAEHRLALKLTIIIVGILIAIVVSVFFLGSNLETRQEVDFFHERMEKMQKNGRIDDLTGSVGLNRPGFPGRGNPRNVVIIDANGTKTVFGFLAETEFEIPKNIQIEKRHNLEIDGNKILLYGFNLGDKRIFFYENIDLITKLRANVLFGSIGAILVFGFFLYFIALWIAKKTIEPIRKSEEYARSYNHHIAHELKTPLSVINSDLDLALRIPEEAKEYIQSAIEESKNMRKTVDDLLFLAELEAKTTLSQINFGEEGQSVQEEISKIFSTKKFHFSFFGDKDIKILADQRLLRVLLRNVYENACKYSLPETDIITEISEKGFVIKNTIGADSIPNVDSLFTPFIGTPGNGNGLGLSIVKRICVVHKWTAKASVENSLFILAVDFK